MFAKTIIDSDAFLDMPVTAQWLYFHMAMRADDEGFVNKPRSVMRMIGARDDDARVLIAKKFILPFESGVIVIKHWKIHNYIRGDRLSHTKYNEERKMLDVDVNGSYRMKQEGDCQLPANCLPDGSQEPADGIPDANQWLPQDRLDKDRLDKDSIESIASDDAPPHKNIKPTLDMVTAYFEEIGSNREQAEAFCDHYSSNGWKVGGKAPMKDWRASARGWVRRDKTPATTNAAKASGRVVDRQEHSGHDILQPKRGIRLKRED